MTRESEGLAALRCAIGDIEGRLVSALVRAGFGTRAVTMVCEAFNEVYAAMVAEGAGTEPPADALESAVMAVAPPPEAAHVDGPRRVSVAAAALLLGKPAQYVRHGLRTRRLPIGSATSSVGATGKERWTYHVSPGLLAWYSGATAEQLASAVKEAAGRESR